MILDDKRNRVFKLRPFFNLLKVAVEAIGTNDCCFSIPVCPCVYITRVLVTRVRSAAESKPLTQAGGTEVEPWPKLYIHLSDQLRPSCSLAVLFVLPPKLSAPLLPRVFSRRLRQLTVRSLCLVPRVVLVSRYVYITRNLALTLSALAASQAEPECDRPPPVRHPSCPGCGC